MRNPFKKTKDCPKCKQEEASDEFVLSGMDNRRDLIFSDESDYGYNDYKYSTGMQTFELAHGAKNIIEQGLDVYKTSLMVQQHIEEIQSSTQVKLANIAAKYNICRGFLEATFAERGGALSQHYNVLDNALKSNDREMVIAALQGISNIVTANPLEKFTDLLNNWDSYSKSKPLELDF